MRYLVDTHALIWYLESNQNLSVKAKSLLENGQTICFVSMASLWELAIKIGLGRLELQVEFQKIKDMIIGFGFEILDIQFDHVNLLTSLPLHHQDPFDRIIISQAMVEDLILITKDEKIKTYPVQTLW